MSSLGCVHGRVAPYCPHCNVFISHPPRIATECPPTVVAEPCSCEESLALRAQLRENAAQLREAAAHLGDVLAGPISTGGGIAEQGPFVYEARRTAAREWLKAYLAKESTR